MAAVIKGKGVVWGVDGVAFTAGIVSATNTAIAQSSSVTRDSNKFDINNEDGETVGQVFYNKKTGLNISVVPTGATVAAAVASLTAHVLEAGTLVTITDSEGQAESQNNYNLISANENRTQDGAAVVDLVLESFDANDVTATIS